MDYAELHCLSNFSFLTGASHPEELVEQACRLGYKALAITDECSLAGVVKAWQAAKSCGLKLLIGSEFRLQDGLRIVLLAKNRKGYAQLSQLITAGRRRADKGKYVLRRDDLLDDCRDGLSDCLLLWLAEDDADASVATWIADRFPARAWIAVELHRRGGDRQRLALLKHLGREVGLPLIAAGGVLMHEKQRQPLQDVLTAIRYNCALAEAGLRLQSNAERYLRPLKLLQRFYPRDLLEASMTVADQCDFDLGILRYEYPHELVPSGVTAHQWLSQLTEEKALERWPQGMPSQVRSTVEHELQLIAELEYEHFFLTVEDIVSFARSQGILCQGRGSAANSAVCYCLGITEVDPSRMEMLFERFLSRERNEPPDIDVDFEHQRREEVLQYIYRKYGRDRAALAATVITYRPRSAIRDVGRALGLDSDQVDRLAKSIAWWDGKEIAPQRLREAGFDPEHPQIRRAMLLVRQLLRFPRHLSQHVGGMVISSRPVSELVPIENAAMEGRTIIQWDKDDLHALGLLKVDCLALGMLSAIRRSIELINGYWGESLSISKIPAEDPQVYAMIQRAETLGVFQIESRAQMAMLPRLKPACFYDLVIEVALVRPGPIQGDMVHPYLRRRSGLEAVDYPSEAVKEALSRTLGVPIFQEQVIKIVQVAAGFSAGEADQVRRSMATWRKRGGIELFEQRLIDGMTKRGYSQEYAERIYQQILGFGEYGFPESHAASFALLVYVSAWLKHHYPAAFFAAMLNSQPMGFYAPAQLIGEARRQGVVVRPVDVCFSHWDCVLEQPMRLIGSAKSKPQAVLRLGLRLVKGLSRSAAQRLLMARNKGAFQHIDDLRSASFNVGDMEALAEAGALRGLSGDRHHSLWQVMGQQQELPLFAGQPQQESTPQLRVPTIGQDIVADYASVGMTLAPHPVTLLRDSLGGYGVVTAKQVRQRQHGEKVRTAGIVINRQHPSAAKDVTFLTIEDETGQSNLVVWGSIARRQRRVLLESRLLGVFGEVQREGEVVHVVAKRLYDYSRLLGNLITESRDFR